MRGGERGERERESRIVGGKCSERRREEERGGEGEKEEEGRMKTIEEERGKGRKSSHMKGIPVECISRTMVLTW